MRLKLLCGGIGKITYGLTTGWLALNIIILGVSELGLATIRRGR